MRETQTKMRWSVCQCQRNNRIVCVCSESGGDFCHWTIQHLSCHWKHWDTCMYCYRSGLRQSVMEKGKLIVNFVYQLTTRVLEFFFFFNNHVRFFLGKIKGSKVLIVRYLVLLSRNSPREVATTLWRSAPTFWHPPRTNTLFLDRLTWLSTT